MSRLEPSTLIVALLISTMACESSRRSVPDDATVAQDAVRSDGPSGPADAGDAGDSVGEVGPRDQGPADSGVDRPRIVRSVPAANALVSARSLSPVRVEFDRAMKQTVTTSNYSISRGVVAVGGDAPVRWAADGASCEITVPEEAGSVYRVALPFEDLAGTSLDPAESSLTFTTQ